MCPARAFGIAFVMPAAMPAAVWSCGPLIGRSRGLRVRVRDVLGELLARSRVGGAPASTMPRGAGTGRGCSRCSRSASRCGSSRGARRFPADGGSRRLRRSGYWRAFLPRVLPPGRLGVLASATGFAVWQDWPGTLRRSSCGPNARPGERHSLVACSWVPGSDGRVRASTGGIARTRVGAGAVRLLWTGRRVFSERSLRRRLGRSFQGITAVCRPNVTMTHRHLKGGLTEYGHVAAGVCGALVSATRPGCSGA